MGLVEIYAKWVFAGFIVTLIFLLAALIGGFSSFLTELVTDAAFGMIPFPFDLIVTWSMNPLPVVIQAMITAMLLFSGNGSSLK